MGKTATIIGATGLVGGYLLEELLRDPYYTDIRILTRRPIDITHPKLEKKIVDFADSDSMLIALDGSDTVFCAIGTTQKKVKGDLELYRKIDYEIPVRAAKLCKLAGCESFILVSAVGANPKSKNFYLRLKGEVENSIMAVGLQKLYIMRPSMLLGSRKEFRLAEKIAQPLMKAFSFIIPNKYRAIHAKDVATAMVRVSKGVEDGVFFLEYAEMKK